MAIPRNRSALASSLAGGKDLGGERKRAHAPSEADKEMGAYTFRNWGIQRTDYVMTRVSPASRDELLWKMIAW